MNWHRLSIQEAFELLGSNSEGLTNESAEEKLAEQGYNQLQESKKKNISSIFFSQFKDIMILVLLASAVVSGIIGDLSDTIVILIIVLLNAIIGFLQEYRAEKAMQALKKMAVQRAKVIRHGEKISVSSLLLVPGDIVMLEAGDAIPADLRIMESINLKIEEAALTGESLSVDKIIYPLEQDHLVIGDRRNMAYKGTFVTNGRGKGIVVATGMQTELGRIAKMLEDKEPLTPLQERMAAFGKKLSALVLFLCVLFFLGGWWRGEDLFKMIMTSISLAIASIPEALPAVITISLALAARRMIKLHSLIRKLHAVETLGSVTYVCTDKTGTLTKNKMTVVEILVDGKKYTDHDFNEIIDAENGSKLLEAFVLNNDAVKADDHFKGDATEVALMEVAYAVGIDVASIGRIAEIPFDADRKLMTTFHHYNDKIISFTKGAPDILLKQCVNVDQLSLHQTINEMASKGLRIIGFGYRYWDHIPAELHYENTEKDLHFLGFCGMIDPPRVEVFEAVRQCKDAGIVPVMITGDHPMT
ncbi:MAG: cation-translocating P-type ATPase, partial [Bacteroidota bacterium]